MTDYWTVRERLKPVWGTSGDDSTFKIFIFHVPDEWAKALKDEKAKYGRMTKEEAAALARLLNASEIEA